MEKYKSCLSFPASSMLMKETQNDLCSICFNQNVIWFLKFLIIDYRYFYLRYTEYKLLRLLEKHNALRLPLSLCSTSSSSSQLSRSIGEFGAKNYFTDHETANIIQLFVPIKGNFLVYSFSEQVSAKGNPPETT